MEQKFARITLAVLITAFGFNFIVIGHPLNGKEVFRNQSESFEYLNDTNDTAQDLIVIRTVVYEVGILTNAEDSEDIVESEQVDLTFFDPAHNSSAIDLSNIPIPIQTNISGVSVTGVAPGNLGIIKLPEDDDGKNNVTFTSPVLPNAVVTVTRHVSTSDANKTQEILNQITPLVDIPTLTIRDIHPKNTTETEEIVNDEEQSNESTEDPFEALSNLLVGEDDEESSEEQNNKINKRNNDQNKKSKKGNNNNKNE